MITATVLIGVSGSGKSTAISEGTFGEICSTDKYVEKYADDRGLNYSDAFDKIQEDNLFKDFTRLFYIDIENCIRNNVDFVIDRTNLTADFRKQWIGEIKTLAGKFGKEVAINGLCFDLSKDIVKKRLDERFKTTGKSIPADVIENQFNAFELPTISEGFTDLVMVKDI